MSLAKQTQLRKKAFRSTASRNTGKSERDHPVMIVKAELRDFFPTPLAIIVAVKPSFPAQSSRLENLRIADGHAQVDLDGTAVELAGAKADAYDLKPFNRSTKKPTASSSLIRPAPQARRQRHRHRRGLARWWQRLRNWFSRWLAIGQLHPCPAALPRQGRPRFRPPVRQTPPSSSPTRSPKRRLGPSPGLVW